MFRFFRELLGEKAAITIEEWLQTGKRTERVLVRRSKKVRQERRRVKLQRRAG